MLTRGAVGLKIVPLLLDLACDMVGAQMSGALEYCPVDLGPSKVYNFQRKSFGCS